VREVSEDNVTRLRMRARATPRRAQYKAASSASLSGRDTALDHLTLRA